jgi:hypothetical protein
MSNYKFIKTPDKDNDFDKTTVDISFFAEDLSTMIEVFKEFLLSVGYSEKTVERIVIEEK